MDFVLFLLLNAVLFIRPAEVVPALLGLPLYEVLSLGCLAASLPALVRQLRPAALGARPITVCVMGLFAAVVLSHLVHFALWGVQASGVIFARLAVYYLLLVAIVNTPIRLRRFLLCLIGLVTVLAAVAVGHYHGIVTVPALTTVEEHEEDPLTGESIIIPRLRSTGIYHDPNDLSQILIVGILLCLYGLVEWRARGWRLACLAPLLFFVYALALTKLRGGLLALLAGLLTLFQARFGWRKTLLLAGAGVPLLLLVFGGRQTNLSAAAGSGQERIRLWSEGLGLLRESPLFGIGQGEFVERAGLVAHNSFVHCYAELGLLGGTLFLSAFCCAVWGLARLNARRAALASRTLRGACPYLLAITLSYAVGLLTLSRAYVTPTYAVLGLAAVFLRLASPGVPARKLRLNAWLLRRLAVASAACIVGHYVFVRTFAHWGG